MANSVSNVSFQGALNPYSVELQDIERKRRLAEAFQQQGMQPLGNTEVIGGWAMPKSPMEGVGKMAQALSGAWQDKRASEQEKALGAKYSSDLSSTLSRALQAGAGTPAKPDFQPEADPGLYVPGQAAVAPDRSKMAQILMEHPGTQPLGMQQLTQDMSRQALIAALSGGQSASMGANGSPGASPASAPQGSAVGGPAGGVPMAAWLQVDPTGTKYMEQLAHDHSEGRKVTALRPGAPGVNANGEIVFNPTPNVPQGVQLTPGAKGTWNAGVVPGITGAQESLGITPMQEVTNADQTKSYIPKAQLAAAARPSAISNSAPQPSVRVSPQLQTQRDSDRLRILQEELKANPNDPALKAEIAKASSQFPNAPRFGQTQDEQIRQQRETAGGKAQDEAVGKDLGAFMTGGAQDATRQIAQLGDALAALEKPGSDLTGPVVGRIPDFVLNFTNPQAVAMRERVEEVVQRSLRAILGAQFTEKEGERLISRAYNPSQSPAENAVRVRRLYTQLQGALQQKMDLANYFQKNGTMQGWQGKLPSLSDFDVGNTTSSGPIGGASIRAQADAILGGK